MNLADLKYVFSLQPWVIAKKIARKGKVIIADRIERRKALNQDPRAYTSFPKLKYTYLDATKLNVTQLQAIDFLMNRYLDHRFDLLGSGWVKNEYSTVACGLEDYSFDMNLEIAQFDYQGDWLEKVIPAAHIDISRRYWQEIVNTNPDYHPIDWQKDFKSGFRWNAKTWFKNQLTLMKNQKGIDLKVPWELSRLQHLPQLALFAIYAPHKRVDCIREFKCQVLDFFATNPPGLGVNFSCAMDVGIRVANLLVAFDLFSQLDTEGIIDHGFRNIFSKNIYLHGRHILQNLEYREGLTSNHYLGNISGLLFAAAYLEENKEIDQWLAYAVQELVACEERQFFDDGTNFEGSTSYHRLSGEMILYSAALVVGLKESKRESLKNYSPRPWKYQGHLKKSRSQKFNYEDEYILPQSFFEKLYNASVFSHFLTKPNGCIAQFGDNDSGRFFRLSPNGQLLTHQDAVNKYQNLENYKKQYSDEFYWDENDLNHDPFITGCCGLFYNTDLDFYTEKFPLEASFVFSLSGGIKIENTRSAPAPQIGTAFSLDKASFRYSEETIFKDPKELDVSLTRNLELRAFPDFQLYILRSDRVFLAIAGISNPNQHHTWGHTHNDKLSIELSIDGQDIVIDPGTYLYTPIPSIRNELRSVSAHNTLITKEGEQNVWAGGKMGLFKLYGTTSIEVLELGKAVVALQLKYRSVHQIRKVTILEEKIVIKDYSKVPFKVNFDRNKVISNGYGKLIRG